MTTQPATTMADAGSLDRLHDLLTPGPTPWWPPAPGWYVLGGIVLAVGIVWLVDWYRRYRRNLYRRQALAELRGQPTVTAIATVLKRTALSVFPRDRVAALHGEAWIAFLNQTCERSKFDHATGEQLNSGPFDPRTPPPSQELLAAARAWITHHQPEATT